MCEYIADCAAEEISNAMNVLGEKTEWERLSTFQPEPVVTMKVWGLVQQMEAESLVWLCIMGPENAIKRYNDLYVATKHCYFDEHPKAPGCFQMVKIMWECDPCMDIYGFI